MSKIKRFDELFKVGSAKRVLKSQWKEEGVPFYRGREVTKLSMKGSVDNQLFITKTHFEELKKKHGVPNVGDIIMTAIGTIGNAYIVKSNDEFYFKDASVLWLNRTSDILSKYVGYFIKSDLFKSQLDVGNGATVDTLTIKKLSSIEIMVPSIEEQQRIVAKLDVVFTETDNSIHLEEEKKIQSRSALKSIYRDILYNRQSSLGLKKNLLGDVCKVVGGNGFPISYQGHGNKEIPFIKVSDMNTLGNEKYIYQAVHTVDVSILKTIKAKAHEAGTLIFPKIGGAISTNKKRLLSKLSAYDNNVVGIKSSDRLLPEYLHKIFKIIDIYELSNKAALPSINNPAIESIELFVPNLQEQSKIIQKLNLVDEHFSALSICASSKIRDLKLLKSLMVAQNLLLEVV